VAAVVGAGDGISVPGWDDAEVTLVIRGTVEKSPGALSIIRTTAAVTRAVEASAIRMTSSLVF
jgi:hypothetical protein